MARTFTPGRSPNWICAAMGLLVMTGWSTAARLPGGELTVEIRGSNRVKLVGAFDRWDQDGNPRRMVNPKARIDSPETTATATSAGGNRWRFENLPPGRYDLVLMVDDRVRLEGFHYPPVLEFDPVVTQKSRPSERVVEQVGKDIAKSKHYENKVEALYFAGTDKQVRVLMQLLRDDATSFDADFGQPVATLRYEIWQYANQYGGWAKEKRTRVMHRVIMGKRDLRTWTWLWDDRLGGIEVGDEPRSLVYELPQGSAREKLRGLRPY